MAFVWLCATPCDATGLTAGGGAGVAALPAVSRPDAAVEPPLHSLPALPPLPALVALPALVTLPALVALPALRRGAVALVLAVAAVAGVSAGDAPAIVLAAAPDGSVAASTPAPAGPDVELLFPDGRARA